MVKNYVVVAHFDAFNRLDQNFKLFLFSLQTNFDRIILVSTSKLRQEDVAMFPMVTLLVRPNIGYDFYSYKVGYNYIIENFESGNILFTNSSFFLLNPIIFQKTLRSSIKAINNLDVLGMTSSNQISWHLQSYFLFLNSRVLNLIGIRNFINEIRPLNSKFELIIQYELGMSKLFCKMELKCGTLYRASIYEKAQAYYEWGKRVYRSTQKRWKFIEAVRESHNANLTHFCAKGLAKKFGIIKAEVVRTNPHSLDLNFLNRISPAEIIASINDTIQNSKSLYQTDGSGMTNLIRLGNSDTAFREVSYGKRWRPGVRIAVVIHLYYFDLLDEISAYLDAIVEPYDLYVTTPFDADIPGVINKMASKAISITVLVCENRGRDIGPFIKLYRSGYLDGYMTVLKLHSKKSKYSSEGQEWRRQLYQKVVGDSMMVRKILKSFESGFVGIVGPGEFYLTNGSKFWGANYEALKKILQSTKKFSKDYEPPLGFFAGSMFWFSPKAFIDIKEINPEHLDFEIENGKQDGTLAHAYERAFCLLSKNKNMIVTTSIAPMEGVDKLNNFENKVPVLKT